MDDPQQTSEPTSRTVRPVLSRRMRLLVFAGTALVVGSGFAATLGLLGLPGPSSTIDALLPSPPWWAYVIALVGAVVTGLLAATYIGSPPGAEATVCDLRWPLIGIVGLTLAIERAVPGSFIGDLFGTSQAVQIVVQPVIGLGSLALLIWALRGRAAKERSLRAAAQDSDSGHVGVACTTCRPLFPSK